MTMFTFPWLLSLIQRAIQKGRIKNFCKHFFITNSKYRKRSSITGSRIDRRRQVHVRCEHRRRKEIQECLDALEAELPGQAKRRSKGDIISDSAEMIKELTFTLDRLLNENQALLNRAQVNEYTKWVGSK